MAARHECSPRALPRKARDREARTRRAHRVPGRDLASETSGWMLVKPRREGPTM
jgi:hypothetical protein